MRTVWLVGVLATAATSFLGWQNHVLSKRMDALAGAVEKAGPASPLPAPSLTSCFLSPAFARQLADELRGPLGSTALAAPIPTAATAETQAPAPDTEAFDNANHVLDEIIDRGRITLEDLNALRRELASATNEQRDQVRARIAAAVNREELVADDPHALYP
jgi:hypothetical protein